MDQSLLYNYLSIFNEKGNLIVLFISRFWVEIPTEKGFNLQSIDYAMPKKVFPISNDFVLNSFGLLKGHGLEAIASILSWYVETMECLFFHDM